MRVLVAPQPIVRLFNYFEFLRFVAINLAWKINFSNGKNSRSGSFVRGTKRIFLNNYRGRVVGDGCVLIVPVARK